METKINHGDVMTISLTGRLDTVTSAELSKELEKEEIKEGLVIMDMKDLEYISSAGLRLLLSFKKKLSSDGKSLEIHNLNDVCKEVFRVTGFKNILTVK
ncbi:MAG: STAS domain-containing protein [Bacilli bacterium]|nr:STAS domain-containing protein [Bacilli bacterium]